MNYSENLNLLKPTNSDIFSVDHQNENMDILDAKIKELEESIQSNGGLEDIEEEIESINTTLTEVNTSISNINTEINGVKTDLSEIETSLSETNETINTTTSDLDSLQEIYGSNHVSMNRKVDTTVGEYSFAFGYDTEASGANSHAEGYYTTASGVDAHAEGYHSKATNAYAHAEGYYTVASGESSHAEGYDTEASGNYSHAEGYNTTASGDYSHVEGYSTTASGRNSHAEGSSTEAKGGSSHAEGNYTLASSTFQHVQGQYNIEDTESKYAHIVGNGTYDVRSNAHTLDWDGNAWFAGDVTNGQDVSLNGLNEKIDESYQQSTGYTDQAIANLINSAPTTLDTLGEIATAMEENASVVEALDAAIGTKANQTELDTHTGNTTIHITSTERTNWNDANSKKHEHSNKSVLDGITSALITAWSNAVTHISDTVKHITSEERTLWNSVSNKADASSVPTKVSELENDSGYITSTDINTSQDHVHTNKDILDTTTASYTVAEQTKLSSIPYITFATEEPTEVAENTIVMVYEE